jgi:hypothetical protein
MCPSLVTFFVLHRGFEMLECPPLNEVQRFHLRQDEISLP